ncbi:MAG: amidohydrolase, partial [Eudoraea sp.]|nr:amidohydrolase [Eudoraea sp.]
MKQIVTAFLVVLLSFPVFAQKMGKNKRVAISAIEKHEQDLIRASDSIWALAETAFEEDGSAEILARMAEENGFQVERGVAGMPTAFVATFGSGRPVISVLGEFDALPGISQKAQPTKEPLNEGAAGHGCGHNLFG